MCRSVRGGTLAASRSSVESVKCVTQLFVIGSWEVHARPSLPRSMQALAQWLYCASCVLHRPGVSSSARIQQHPKLRMLDFAQFTLM